MEIVDIMMCPVCRAEFKHKGNSIICESGHCFDISHLGYINMLAGSRAFHGDNSLMIEARQRFLESGAYSHLSLKICDILADNVKENCVIVDVGCGNGYYSDAVKRRLDSLGIKSRIFAFDVSKYAVCATAKKNKSLNTCVASVFSIPYRDSSADAVISVFSPLSLNEFSRILKKGSLLVMALPNPRHLYALKQCLYETPYENEVKSTDIDGFELTGNYDVARNISLGHDALMDLFMMTPYYYRTSDKDKEKISSLEKLTVEADFKILTYKKL